MVFFSVRNLLWKSIKLLANLNFSIFILLFICLSSMIGSIIEQDQNIIYYQQNYSSNNFFFNWRFIKFLQLDHLYQAWWFIGIIIVFIFSLTICTFSIQFPSLKNARRWKFFVPSNKIHINHNLCKLKNNSFDSISNAIYALVCHNFYVFHKKNFVYSYKGILGRVAPIFVHFSIIIAFVGFIFSAFGGYIIQEMIPKNESFHMKNILYSGFYSNLDNNFLVKADDFFILYNTDNSVKQFFSKLSILDSRYNVIKQKLISVNYPLRFNRLTFYQTDWNINALRIQVGSIRRKVFQKTLLKLNINNKICWLCLVPINHYQKIFFIFFNLQEPIFICDLSGNIIDTFHVNQKIYINSICFCVKDIMVNTGLQIKVDPGIPLVYLGFFILIISTFISYISYSQIWITFINNIFSFAYSTNRSILFFEEEIFKINIIYNNYTFLKTKLKQKRKIF